MKKPFMEVFPTLQLREELKSVLEFASIDRITMNRDRDFMRIYLESDKLIVKSCIFELEQAITGQLFPDAKMTVKVIERFHLSRQYTPQNLMPIYEESILLELKAYNALLYSLMHDSKKVFSSEDTLCLEVPDTVIADGKEQELLQILEKIFCERCGLNCSCKHKTGRAAQEQAAEKCGAGARAGGRGDHEALCVGESRRADSPGRRHRGSRGKEAGCCRKKAGGHIRRCKERGCTAETQYLFCQ